MSETDKRIGSALLTARSTTTQQAVADAMRERGHKWSQATVWSVEKGERPLRLTEANDLVQILGITIADLTSEPVELEANLLIRRYFNNCQRLVDATRTFLAAQREIEDLLAQVESDDRTLPEAIVAALHRLAKEPVEDVIRVATRQPDEREDPDYDGADEYTQHLIDFARDK